jgi:integrase
MYQRRDPKTGKRRGNWYIRINGVRTSSGTKDRERARRREHKENKEGWDTRYGLVIPTWERAALNWTNAYPKESGTKNNLLYAKWWLEQLQGKRLTEINRELIHGVVSKHFQVDLPKLIKYPQIQYSDKWTTPENWYLIRDHLTPDELDMATFILATGVREDNGLFFEWPWDKGTWALIPPVRTKTDTPYGIPLNKTAQAILKKRKKEKVKHLKYPFTIEGKEWYPLKLLRALKRACKAAGVPVVTVHGLRHSFATWLAQNGVPKEIRQRLMGHSVKDVQDVYSHFDVESLRKYAEIAGEIASHQPRKGRQVAVK